MLAAETLALTDACDIAFNISSVINILMNKKITIKHSPYDTTKTTKLAAAR